MKRIFSSIIVLAIIFGLTVTTHASPLTMNYSVSDLGGGLYRYSFDLVLDNHDNSWLSGQGWSWIVFGDEQNQPSPLNNFTIDPASFPMGPFTFLTTSIGFHNGPTFIGDQTHNIVYWIPNSVGEALIWSGTASVDLKQRELLFSTLAEINDAILANFQVANRVPEPSTMLLLGFGLIGLAGYGRNKFFKK